MHQSKVGQNSANASGMSSDRRWHEGTGGDRGANHTFLCNTAAVWREGRAVKMSDGPTDARS